ncbi:uncharacterized protein LOC128675764 [Plodia interpunctella]|uniref:uncharacterized protein LOC128675764 n=1 Tax=Plodia interpunctella TaxID=58824 RepID=UPI002367FA4D|nr:uncharacterized protein LOC128675764 [Plodia interpunctella]
MENYNEINTSDVSTSNGTGSPAKPSADGDGPGRDTSQTLFPESPVYEPEEDLETQPADENVVSSTDDKAADQQIETKASTPAQVKRKLSDEPSDNSAKIQKLELAADEFAVSSQSLDAEVCEISFGSKRKLEDPLPSTSRVRTPAGSSPRKITKRSNSTDISTPKTPRTPRTRPASADITKSRKTPRKIQLDKLKEAITEEPKVHTPRPSVEFVKEIPPPSKVTEVIVEESNSELNDSQNFHLELSPNMDDQINDEKAKVQYSSDPVVVKDRVEILNPGMIKETHSEGYKYSDHSLSQSLPKDYNKGKTTDQESTDSVCSIIESPDHIPQSAASKIISKLSNGNSSTPTEILGHTKRMSTDDSDSTPDMIKLNGNKGKRLKNESFRASNTTTPSTISPLQNGHSLPINTPQIPVFDIHVSHNEDCEFLSLYVVRTDNDLGMDMCKEYQRISKRFTIDPYMADVSVSNSPSSVTSGGMINLPNRTSFASTVSSMSTSSSNRTSDGAFVVPQPPRKSVSNPSTSVKGYEALMKKLQDIFSHIRETSVDDGNHSLNDEKVSVGIQASLSSDSSNQTNGNASPDEVGKCDKATPKSSLKKSRVRGRRHIAGKTKRAILPTQQEEAEYMHGMNSPEMVQSNGDSGKMSPKSPKDEKPLSSLVATPKSVSKLKQKRRPTSPRPATPVEKPVVKQEYPGYPADTVVLAKWVDKRYYSGRVIEITEPNKYLIKFDDGHSKALLDDFIIFGDMKTLPLQGQSVYAMVDEEQNYEPGLVMGIEENDSGTITYRCITDGDSQVMVTASELYLTEDQARTLKDATRPRSPGAPSTPRRRHNRELDLDNIIQGPRSARSRDKSGHNSARRRVASPRSPKASTSGVKSSKSAVVSRKRLASESSEVSEGSNPALAPARLEEVAGVEPEVQRTPRKIDGVKAGPLQLKGAAKQNIGKKNSKLTLFDEDTVSVLGPIPGDNKLFSGLHFLLTCTETPRTSGTQKQDKTSKQSSSDLAAVLHSQETRHYSSEEDGETTTSMAGTDTEDLEFSDRPFNKERLKEQLEAGGGVVYSHFDDVPKNKYSSCKLIAPRPCLTAKYIQCLAADIPAVSHAWVIFSCINNQRMQLGSYVLPSGWSITKQCFINWNPPSGKRNTTFFKDKTILLCGDQDTFVKFWERVCTLAGANTRVVNEEDLNTTGAIALVTEWDCPHEVQNKANQDMIPLVSTFWVIQCLIEAKILPANSHDRFSFMYAEPE